MPNKIPQLLQFLQNCMPLVSFSYRLYSLLNSINVQVCVTSYMHTFLYTAMRII